MLQVRRKSGPRREVRLGLLGLGLDSLNRFVLAIILLLAALVVLLTIVASYSCTGGECFST